MEILTQIGIALTGVVAIYLSQSSKEQFRKYACIFGLLGQPFWFYSSYVTEQWGIFILCFLYTFSWLKGLKLHWFTNPEETIPSIEHESQQYDMENMIYDRDFIEYHKKEYK